MSDRETRRPSGEAGDPAGQDEGFLTRWARLKEQSRRGVDVDAPGEPPEKALPAEAGPAAGEAQEPEPPGDEDMPPLESLGPDSDYSGFMSPRVSPGLRRQALRRLFASPRFNITDGLDDYCEDFTKWRPLGDIVTADMKYQMERKLREAMEKDAAEQESAEVRQAGTTPAADEPGGDGPGETHQEQAADRPPGDDPNEPGNA